MSDDSIENRARRSRETPARSHAPSRQERRIDAVAQEEVQAARFLQRDGATLEQFCLELLPHFQAVEWPSRGSINTGTILTDRTGAYLEYSFREGEKYQIRLKSDDSFSLTVLRFYKTGNPTGTSKNLFRTWNSSKAGEKLSRQELKDILLDKAAEAYNEQITLEKVEKITGRVMGALVVSGLIALLFLKACNPDDTNDQTISNETIPINMFQLNEATP